MNREELNKSLRTDEVNEYFTVLTDQEARMVSELKTRSWNELGDIERIRDYAPVVRQLLLHRAIKLTKGAGESVLNNNGYVLALSVRAHFETMAAIGYLNHRLKSLREGNITPEEVCDGILTQLFGTRDKKLLRWADTGGFRKDGYKAIQVLTMLDCADKLERLDKFERKLTLRQIYESLSEFCHPNFHSNELVFDPTIKKGSVIFRNEDVLLDKELAPLNGLSVSTIALIEFYDGIDKLLP
jgi:hypothetical protein